MRSINKTIARDPTKCIRRKGQTAPQVSNQTVNTKIREPNVLISIYLSLVMELMAVKR
jgi:hypothetical protein